MKTAYFNTYLTHFMLKYFSIAYNNNLEWAGKLFLVYETLSASFKYLYKNTCPVVYKHTNAHIEEIFNTVFKIDLFT